MATQMVTAYQPPIATTMQVTPCRECGSTGGVPYPDSARPLRARGYCYACYHRLYQQNGILAHRLYANEREMLWHTTAMVRQSHAVIPDYDHGAVTAEAEAFTARALTRRPEQARPMPTHTAPRVWWRGADTDNQRRAAAWQRDRERGAA